MRQLQGTTQVRFSDIFLFGRLQFLQSWWLKSLLAISLQSSHFDMYYTLKIVYIKNGQELLCRSCCSSSQIFFLFLKMLTVSGTTYTPFSYQFAGCRHSCARLWQSACIKACQTYERTRSPRFNVCMYLGEATKWKVCMRGNAASVL